MLSGELLKKAFEDFIVNYSAEKGLEEKTVRNKRDILKGLLPFLNGRPLSVELCRSYVAYKEAHGWKAPNSKLNIVKNLRAFINFLHKRKYIHDNFAHELEKPKVVRKPLKLLSEQKSYDIIIAGTTPGPGDRRRSKFYKEETRLCLLFVLLTGLRINEALSLRGDDLMPFDEIPSFYVTSKNGKSSLMPLPANMIEEMKLRVNKDRVFEATAKTCNKILRDGIAKMGYAIDTTNHKLRDIYSISRLRRGQPLQLVSRTLRHSSVSITDKYYSDYVINDIEPVINDSPLIKGALSEKELIDKALLAFKKVVGDDERIIVEIQQQTNGCMTIHVGPRFS